MVVVASVLQVYAVHKFTFPTKEKKTPQRIIGDYCMTQK